MESQNWRTDLSSHRLADRRHSRVLQSLREQGHSDLIRKTTGLVIDPYFSASKLRWILDHGPMRVNKLIVANFAGTVDWRLSTQ